MADSNKGSEKSPRGECEQLRLESIRLDIEETKARMARDQERHEEETRRNKERHESDMVERVQSSLHSERVAAIQLGIAETISELRPALVEVMRVYKQQLEFGNDNAIRAAACAMIKRAAEEDKPALKEAANQLLDVLNKKA